MNDKDKAPVTIESILEAVKAYEPRADIALIQKAYDLAASAHKGQVRVSGEEYIIHPLHVAEILTELHIDDVTISAALLHDVARATGMSFHAENGAAYLKKQCPLVSQPPGLRRLILLRQFNSCSFCQRSYRLPKC